MAGTNEPNDEGSLNKDCSFEWDETSQLYYHASTGFYHDPNAGWYYSTRDGRYYKYENGNYVLFGPGQEDVDYSLLQGGESEPYKVGTVLDEPSTVDNECNNSQLPENPPPPSEWLEDTLIELYLSGYSNQAINVTSDVRMPVETEDGDGLDLSADGAIHELEEGEWIPEDNHGATDSSGTKEGLSWEEENWRSQYGQVIQSVAESDPDFPVVDLWDWAMITETKKDRKSQLKRLVGRLVKRSAKLHPSMSSGGGRLKTAPICEVHLDLVRVKSGQVYKLRNPNAGYLASLSTYDASNPTKDWGFPELLMDEQIQRLPKFGGNFESKITEGVTVDKDVSLSPEQRCAFQKKRSGMYRDRAGERRSLHGGFGVGPGQKKSPLGGVDFEPSSSLSVCPEEAAAAESLSSSFGAGSYARRMLENMGWKEGEALGNSVKGLTEPLQAIGNKGNAGLGWKQSS